MKKRKLDDMSELRDSLNYDLIMNFMKENFEKINQKIDVLVNKINEMDEKYYSLEHKLKPINKDCEYIS